MCKVVVYIDVLFFLNTWKHDHTRAQPFIENSSTLQNWWREPQLHRLVIFTAIMSDYETFKIIDKFTTLLKSVSIGR